MLSDKSNVAFVAHLETAADGLYDHGGGDITENYREAARRLSDFEAQAQRVVNSWETGALAIEVRALNDLLEG